MGSCQQAEATSRYVVVGTHDTISFTHQGFHAPFSIPLNAPNYGYVYQISALPNNYAASDIC